MLQQFLEILSALGMMGLLLAMAIEGSSIPFPGIIIVLSYGYLFSPSLSGIAITAMMMALSYSLSSYIPYIIGIKIGDRATGILKEKYLKAQNWLNKYGTISIAMTRPLGIGNYISYVGGMSGIKPIKYGILTFIGIYPWCFIMLGLGKLYKGNINTIKAVINQYSMYVYVISALVFVAYLSLIAIKNRVLAKTR